MSDRRTLEEEWVGEEEEEEKIIYRSGGMFDDISCCDRSLCSREM